MCTICNKHAFVDIRLRPGIVTPLKWPSMHSAASTYRHRTHYDQM